MASRSLPAFGQLLKRYRRAAHMTQAQLAERAGFSTDYISKLERGAREPQRATLALLADALSLSTSDRKILESTVHRSRARHDDEATQLPSGAFLGAVPFGPLVGRARELDAITTTLGAAASGQGRMLVLVGEPGVGKTRLAQEITLLARSQGFRLLTGRCYEPQQSLAYAPFIEALAQAVRLTEAAAQTPLSVRGLRRAGASGCEWGQQHLLQGSVWRLQQGASGHRRGSPSHRSSAPDTGHK